MYRCVLEARNAIIAAIKPGATLNSLKDAAEQVYQRHGYREIGRVPELVLPGVTEVLFRKQLTRLS